MKKRLVRETVGGSSHLVESLFDRKQMRSFILTGALALNKIIKSQGRDE